MLKLPATCLLREVHLRGGAVLRITLEVFIPVVKSREICPDAVRKLTNIDVIVFERPVISAPFHGNTVFCAGQFIGQPRELLVPLQVRVLLL